MTIKTNKEDVKNLLLVTVSFHNRIAVIESYILHMKYRYN